MTQTSDRTENAEAFSSRAPVIFSLSGQGGVGRTSMAIHLAQHAAEQGRLDVCLIDMDCRYSDVSSRLGIDRSDLPTILDAAQLGGISPARLESVRGAQAQRVEFSVIRTPHARQTAADEVYRQAIAYARDHYDLVIVDTPIVEAKDTSGLIDGVVIPLMTEGAYAVCLTDQSIPGAENLASHVLRTFAESSVPTENMLTVGNRLGRNVDASSFKRYFGSLSHWVGSIRHDAQIVSLTQAGRIPHHLESVSPVLDAILYRVLGAEEFAPQLDEEAASPGGFQRARSRLRGMHAAHCRRWKRPAEAPGGLHDPAGI